MDKVAIFAFNGNKMCFMHVLLNALEFNKKDVDVKVVIEGEAVKLIKVLEEENNPVYKKVKDLELIDCICKACSSQMGVLEFNESTGIPVRGDMMGHPSFEEYTNQGYEVITL